MTNLVIWLTPIWLLSIGTTIGLVILLLLWAILALVNRNAARSVMNSVRESILLPITYALAAMVVLAVMTTPLMPYDRLVSSLQRLPQVGPLTIETEIEPGTEDQEVDISFRTDELLRYTIESEQEVAINVELGKGFTQPLVLVEGGQLYRWSPGSNLKRGFDEDVDKIYISNESDLATVVRATFNTDVEMPQVHDLATVALSVVGLYLIFLIIRWCTPRISIIATATAKEAMSQPLFILLTVIGIASLIAYIYIPYNTFGEDVKMLKTSGMTTIKVLAIMVALWTASVSVSDEIEGRTALTVLSKPIGRRQFILGKFLGIVWPILLMFVILGIVFLLTVSYKVVYDARESAKVAPMWQECYFEVIRIVPGLVLAFFEAVILAAISVAISTRLPMLPNLVICGSIYVLGHLGPLIVNSSVGDNPFVKFTGRLISVMLPVLDHFEIEGAIAGASRVPTEYLLTALLYSALYCGAAMLLALIFFEDRDLA